MRDEVEGLWAASRTSLLWREKCARQSSLGEAIWIDQSEARGATSERSIVKLTDLIRLKRLCIRVGGGDDLNR